jgi:phosphatidylserine decarboxylase
MRLTSLIDAVFQQEDVNFFITNRVPRRMLTRFVDWFSRIEQPLVRDLSIATFAQFAGDLRLDEARTARFKSLHACFIRELKEGARPVDPDDRILVSPCDGIVGGAGDIDGVELLQAKGSSYTLDELLGETNAAERFRRGRYVTLRLTSSMYHRFHAPCDCRLDGITYISGERWNVNPVTLKRIARVYCKNERAVLHTAVDRTRDPVAIVAIGAILVGSIHLHCLSGPVNPLYGGSAWIPCVAEYRKADELGYFQHGSTIVVLTTAAMDLCEAVRSGATVRMGEPLFRRREQAQST